MTEMQTTYAPAVRPTSGAVEAQRAREVTQVQAKYLVADHRPRSIDQSIRAMEEATQQMLLAERAFYRFPRGGKTVSGPSVQLARELARCWGNISYGVEEISRRPGESEMRAYATDLETNTTCEQTWIVPHRRDKKGVVGGEELTEMRDIYEKNALEGAKRLREQIFNLLPVWFREQAEQNCHATLKDGGGVPIARRRARAIDMFDVLGVTRAQLEEKLGRPADEWTGHDVGQLAVIFKSLDSGETTVGQEFPKPTTGSVEDLTESKATPVKVAVKLDPKLVAELDAAFTGEGWSDDTEERLGWLANHAGRDVTDVNDLTPDEVRAAIATLKGDDK